MAADLTSALIAAARKQLTLWDFAADNYRKLSDVRRKELRYGDLPLATQFNPARAVSTAAKVDSESIRNRPCFLCESNHPNQQFSLERFGDWDVLLNPFPIFDLHFTIVHSQHQPQDNIDFSDMAAFTLSHPSLVAFYNGSAAGASCPDHLHFQATMRSSLPLCAFLESEPGKLIAKDGKVSFYIADALPAVALHIISDTFSPLIARWLDSLLMPDLGGCPSKSLRNVLMWVDDSLRLHTLLFPRSKHRPDCYTSSPLDDGTGRMVSPGAVDMACLVITPRECDYKALNAFDVARILSEVSYDFTSSDSLRNLLMR